MLAPRVPISANIIHEFRVHDDALCPSSATLKPPLHPSLSSKPLFTSTICFKCANNDESERDKICVAGQIYYIYSSYFENHGVYSPQCLKELTLARPIFRHISAAPPPGQEEDPSIEGRSCCRNMLTLWGAALCRFRCRCERAGIAQRFYTGVSLWPIHRATQRGRRAQCRPVSAQYRAQRRKSIGASAAPCRCIWSYCDLARAAQITAKAVANDNNTMMNAR